MSHIITTHGWEIVEDTFPRTATPAVKLQFLLHYAVLAPSTHNSQPWLFKIQDNAVELYLDRTRTLPVADPQGREAMISCGAALFYLRLAIHYFGYTGIVEPFPAPHTPDLLARVRLSRQRVPTDEDVLLFRAMQARHTNRLPFAADELTAPVRAALHAAAHQEGVWLRLIEEPDVRDGVADLIAEGARAQWADPRFREEQAAWVRLLPEGQVDGIPSYNLGLGELAAYMDRRVLRSTDGAAEQADHAHLLAAGAPLLAVITTAADSPLYWLVAGQALARILLQAATAGVAASFLNQPIQMPELRPRLRALLGQPGAAQVLFRLGYGPAVPSTPRRDACEVLV